MTKDGRAERWAQPAPRVVAGLSCGRLARAASPSHEPPQPSSGLPLCAAIPLGLEAAILVPAFPIL